MEVYITKGHERCDSCGGEFLPEDLTEFDGQLLCPDCLGEKTVLCYNCGERVWADDNAGDDRTSLCQHCYDRYYFSCTRCGCIIHEDDAYYETDDDGGPLCAACYNRCHSSGAIEDYYYKPDPIFYGTDPRYFGVELEIDEGDEMDDRAEKLLHIANRKGELIYCKHGGSLNDGFEIMTHPMSLAYHLKEMPWGDILRKTVEMGYTSHQANTCGLHVHVSRDAFGDTASQ